MARGGMAKLWREAPTRSHLLFGTVEFEQAVGLRLLDLVTVDELLEVLIRDLLRHLTAQFVGGGTRG